MVNDPFAGGTDLPDVTGGRADLPRPRALSCSPSPPTGRITPTSAGWRRDRWLWPTEIYQEGFRIPPVKIVQAGAPCRDVLELFLANTRVREEREGDLRAQLAALEVGAERLRALVKSSGRDAVASAMEALKGYAARLMATALRKLKRCLPGSVDYLYDDGFEAGPIAIQV